MKECTACFHENPDAATVCEECGTEFTSGFSSEGTRIAPVEITNFSKGDLIADRYRVVKELGRGGMGVVYLVHDTGLRNRPTALKMIHPELVAHPEALQRFEDEVLLCLDLMDPGIVRVYDLKRAGDLRFFTMEYLEGLSLREWLSARKGQKPPFTLSEVGNVMSQLLKALSHAHGFTIHRDIKPENIMVMGEFPDVRIKLLDFGIARTLSPSRFTQTSHSLGTAYYMAPEQMAGQKEIDHRSDLFAAGMILYEMLTGAMAVGRFRLPGELFEKYPETLDRIIEKALAFEPSERFEDARDMKESLQRALTESPVEMEIPPPPMPPTPTPPPPILDPEKPAAKPVPAPGDTWTEPETGMVFVWVPEGTFQMGCGPWDGEGDDDEQPVHEVELDGFWIGKYPVTQGEWEKVMGDNPSNFQNGDDYPVETVSWNAAQKFIEKLKSLHSGKCAFRLPTEAEWEYACRSGGKEEKYSGGNDIDQVAWYGDNSGGSTHPVGQKAPNGLGVHDMSGNIYEWCEDIYSEDAYKKHTRKNPIYTESGANRVRRGGSWSDNARLCRSADRNDDPPDGGSGRLGFRLACGAG